MFRSVFLACVLLPISLWAQIPVEGVANKMTYTDRVQARVPMEAGYTYQAYLGTNSFPVGAFVTIDEPDYYELRVYRTQTSNGNMAFRLVQFIVTASARGSSEWGLPPHTPAPIIQSAAAEFEGAQLRLLVPASFPSGRPVPMVAWVEDPQGHAVRANGVLEAADQPSIQLRRGVGSGFLNAATASLSYEPDLLGLTAAASIEIDTPTWTTVSGVINGNVVWPADARIQVTGNLTVAAGATLTIEQGTIVRLNNRIDITNNGTVHIEGTLARPVVFMPTLAAQPWGGFIMRQGTGEIHATATIFTGSGAVPDWFGSSGNPSSHRREQALFYVEEDQTVELTDCALIDSAGQFGHSTSGGHFLLTRFLMQRAPSAGQFSDAEFIVNDSAFLEFPAHSSNYVDADNDVLYLESGSQSFTNTLFGWTKDDGIDSGGDGVGTLTYHRCWFEGMFHEGNSLSGSKTVYSRDTIYMDCGQGLEDGYGGPNVRAEHCLFLACQSGARHGDNYPDIGSYTGVFVLTNSILLYNHRDIFAYNWRSSGWTNNYGQMRARGNWLTAVDTNFPDNVAFDPVNDGTRLTDFGGREFVGLSFALWPGPHSLQEFRSGIPVGLSMFSINPVSVDYRIEITGRAPVTGTLVFPPGRVLHSLPVPLNYSGVMRVSLIDPLNADITGLNQIVLQNFETTGETVLVPRGSVWRYQDIGSNEGTAWVDLDFPDDTWLSGAAELGYGDGDEVTTVRSNKITTYFRQAFDVADPSQFGSLVVNLLRDDGAVVYLNGVEAYRSNMPGGTIDYLTLASGNINGSLETTWVTNTVPATMLRAGRNVIAVEIHQRDASSSDISFNLGLTGRPASEGPRIEIGRLGEDVVVFWRNPAWQLEEALVVRDGWANAGVSSPYFPPPDGTRFYRLRVQ